MTGSSSGGASIIPAKVSFLALYSSSLRVNKEQDEEEIAYFRSTAPGDDYTTTSQSKAASRENRDVNWQLRQIGLARGIVQFAAELSEGRPAESVETDKTRIITRELESDWWLLACIELTRITTPQKDAHAGIKTEYSAREVAPPEVLLQQCTRAHRTFLLHHASSLSDLLARVKREKFAFCLAKFWDQFFEEWDPLIHGSPSAELYDAIPLGIRGELGSGTAGDGRNGSEEREIIEGFVARTDGLVDMVVARCGAIAPTLPPYMTRPDSAQIEDGAAYADGTIFSGTGALSRRCIRSVAGWIEHVGRRGINAYGILENPSANPRRKKGKAYDPYASFSARSVRGRVSPSKDDASEFKIPAPIVGSLPQRVKPGAEGTQKEANSTKPTRLTQTTSEKGDGGDGAKAGTEVVKYLTLGIYGSSWGIPSGRPATAQATSSTDVRDAPTADEEPFSGYFLIGLLGDLDESWLSSAISNPGVASQVRAELDSRISVRHLHVERAQSSAPDTEQHHDATAQGSSQCERVRVIVYVQAPFIFTMLFDQHTDALAMPSFYRSLHHQLGPLRTSLLTRTDPETHAVVKLGLAPPTPARPAEPIYSLVYDPEKLTVHTTIPPIPPLHTAHESGHGGAQASASRAVSSSSSSTTTSSSLSSTGWSRFEALAVHQQMLNIYLSTRRRPVQVERTCKTNRGWWMVWMRIPPLLPLATADAAGKHCQTDASVEAVKKAQVEETSNTQAEDASSTAYREAFLLRKASDYRAMQPRKTTGSSFGGFGFSFGGSRSTSASATQSNKTTTAASSSSSSSGSAGAGGGWTEGIGVDARQYIESLLSLSR